MGQAVALTFVLHPTDQPGPGWRWAVHQTREARVRQNPLRQCVRAGWAATRQQADLDGQETLYACMTLIGFLGGNPDVDVLELDHDPLLAVATEG